MSKSKQQSNTKTEAPRRRGRSVLKKVLDIEHDFIDGLKFANAFGVNASHSIFICGGESGFMLLCGSLANTG
jgi:hypothetical protein